MDEAGAFSGRPGSAHSRYLELFRYIRERDEEIAAVFDDQRRSTAYVQIARAISAGVIRRMELNLFSEETRAVIERMLESA